MNNYQGIDITVYASSADRTTQTNPTVYTTYRPPISPGFQGTVYFANDAAGNPVVIKTAKKLWRYVGIIQGEHSRTKRAHVLPQNPDNNPYLLTDPEHHIIELAPPFNGNNAGYARINNENYRCLILEFANGGSFKDYARINMPIPTRNNGRTVPVTADSMRAFLVNTLLPRLDHLFIDAIKGLNAVRKRGHKHNDPNMGNFLLFRQDQVGGAIGKFKLHDFGLSFAVWHHGNNETIEMKTFYMWLKDFLKKELNVTNMHFGDDNDFGARMIECKNFASRPTFADLKAQTANVFDEDEEWHPLHNIDAN